MSKRWPVKDQRAEAKRLAELVARFAETHGGRVDKRYGTESVHYTIPTTLGDMSIGAHDTWLACRFLDVKRATDHFGFELGYRFNPYSGKWNWGYIDEHYSAERLFSDFEYEAKEFLPS